MNSISCRLEVQRPHNYRLYTVPKFQVRNVPNFKVRNVPNMKLRNVPTIQVWNRYYAQKLVKVIKK